MVPSLHSSSVVFVSCGGIGNQAVVALVFVIEMIVQLTGNTMRQCCLVIRRITGFRPPLPDCKWNCLKWSIAPWHWDSRVTLPEVFDFYYKSLAGTSECLSSKVHSMWNAFPSKFPNWGSKMTQDFVGIAVSKGTKWWQDWRVSVARQIAKLRDRHVVHHRLLGPREFTGGRTQTNDFHRWCWGGPDEFFLWFLCFFLLFLLQSPNIRNVDDIDAIDAIDDIDDMEYNHDDIDRAQKCLDDFDMSSLLPCWAMRFQCLVVSAWYQQQQVKLVVGCQAPFIVRPLFAFDASKILVCVPC